MNIHALLSPTESPGREDSSSSTSPPPPAPARGVAAHGNQSSLRRELSRSPGSPHSAPTSRPSTGHDSPTRPQQAFRLPAFQLGAVPNFRPLQAPPTSHPTSAPDSSPPWQGHVQTHDRPLIAQRTASTPHIETSAVLASMQRQQSGRALSTSDIHQHPPPPARQQEPTSLIDPTPSSRPPIFQNASGRSLIDLTMSGAAAQTPPPRIFESKVLSERHSQRVTDLLNYLNENPYAYDSHVELVNLLHQSFRAHVSPPTNSNSQERDPHDYDLLKALRQACETMDTRFAVGEDIWDDWLTDEIMLATTNEERMHVTELFSKAVQDEPSSVKLWQLYAGWVWVNYKAVNPSTPPASAPQPPNNWTGEDKLLCKDIFTRNLVIEVLESAIAKTQWRVDESHVVWNRYAELVQEDFPTNPSPKEVERLRGMYVARLQFPHATWEETSQMFWTIVSKYEGNNWEAIMAEVQGLTGPAKTQMNQREPHEATLRRAIEAADRDAVFHQFAQYLQWERNRERKQRHRSALDKELRCALYERALLRFPTYTEWWLDYVDFVISSGPSTPVLPLIERATRHCPWSGELWARRILQSDVEGKPHHEIEATKHRATNSGLLDVGGMEEMVKVLQQWCSFLRRHAFKASSTEDNVDTAEVGIMMALEDIQQAGKKIYGKDFTGDPLFRVEQIQIKFLSEARRFDDARKIYQGLVKTQKNSYDFWAKYYSWELWIWGYDRIKDVQRVETLENGPDKATAVLQEALSQRDLDWPDKVVDLYLAHFQQHESGQRLRIALVEAREFTRQLANRRAAAAADAVQQDPAATPQQPAQPPAVRGAEAQPARVNDVMAGEKRKRLDETMTNGHSEKKTKIEAVPTDAPVPEDPPQEPSASASAQIKRDREHNTITVKNLPVDVEELDVKKFFREVGAPLSINLLQDKSGETATATVEFESHEDVLTAKTRNGKELKGNEVRIQSGTQSTLYVTNYPAEFDENDVRKLFEGYGDVVSVRFPSLKYNSRRRFCYVQFLTFEMAKAAEDAIDGKMLDGSHRLVAKISDPDAKKQRSGAQAEGRELFVKNLERNASDDEVKQFFERYGTVVNMNTIKLVSGKKTGTAFIVFSSADEATNALEADSKPFQDRILHVELASAKGRAAPLDRARKEDIIIAPNTSASPEPHAMNGRRGSDVSMSSNPPSTAPTAAAPTDDSYKTARERKIAIFSLPDTVNDARVRAAMEEHGPLVKIQMRRQDHGAIVEFADVKTAFHVRQGVDCAALGPEVRTGDVADLLARARKRQADQGSSATPPTATAGDAGAMRPPSVIARPLQRGGRRGGLGFKRGGGAFGAGRSADRNEGGYGKNGAKNNDDFRNLFVKGEGDAADSKGDAQDVP